MTKILFGLIVVFLLLLPFSHASAHETEASKADIGIDEKLGQVLPRDLFFINENGKQVNLWQLTDKPALIVPVYFGCVHVCPMLLSGVAEVLGRIELLKPGKDFQVITVSFDENDKPAIASAKKRNYLKAVGKPFPDNAWSFLTGDRETITRFTDSIGFKFQRDGEHDFSHPVVAHCSRTRRKDRALHRGRQFPALRGNDGSDRGFRGQTRFPRPQGAFVLLQLRSAQEVLCLQHPENDGNGDDPVRGRIFCIFDDDY